MPIRATVRAARPPERGSATVEFALVLPVVVSLIVLLSAFGSATVGQLRCADAARAVARSAAIGSERVELDAMVDRLAGASADLQLKRDGEWVRVTVSAPVTNAVGGLLPQRVTASAAAWCEPGSGG